VAHRSESDYDDEMKLGSHLSIAGDISRALTAADAYGFESVAIFLRNQRQWRSPELTDEVVKHFRAVRRTLNIAPIVGHGSYLVNLAGSDEIRAKSLPAVADELDRCGRLGVEYLVIHPGANPDLEAGIGLIADGLNKVMAACPHRRVKILLETTAGAGNAIGHRFEHLAEILRRLKRPTRFGVCLDTCHIFGAGYDIRTPKAYGRTMTDFDNIIGIDRLLAIHVNDSLKPLGSRRDRHAHIGAGEIGLKGFANLVNDPRLADLPMIMETPKGEGDDGPDMDTVNADTLRGLIRKPRKRRG
jgi:deoxyribonuclease IV